MADTPSPVPKGAANAASGNKIADRPHRWTVTLSILATCVSLASASFAGFSLLETHANRKLNEETSRASLSITSLVLDTTLFTDKSPHTIHTTGQIAISNTGKVAATSVSVGLNPNPVAGPKTFIIAQLPTVNPGSSPSVRVSVYLDGDFEPEISENSEYVIGMQLEYLDGIGNEEKRDRLTFCLPKEKATGTSRETLYQCDEYRRLSNGTW